MRKPNGTSDENVDNADNERSGDSDSAGQGSGQKGAADGIAPRPFECKMCSRTYTRQEHLKRHNEQKHTGARAHVCKYCSRAFARRDVWKKHEALHQRSPQMEHECIEIRAVPADRTGGSADRAVPSPGHSAVVSQKQNIEVEHYFNHHKRRRVGPVALYTPPSTTSTISAPSLYSGSASDDDNEHAAQYKMNTAAKTPAPLPSPSHMLAGCRINTAMGNQPNYATPSLHTSDGLQSLQQPLPVIIPVPLNPVHQSPSASDYHYPNDQRKYRTACRRCHNLKVKCSGGQPCQHCQQRRLDCVYRSSIVECLDKAPAAQETMESQEDAHFRESTVLPNSAELNVDWNQHRLSASSFDGGISQVSERQAHTDVYHLPNPQMAEYPTVPPATHFPPEIFGNSLKGSHADCSSSTDLVRRPATGRVTTRTPGHLKDYRLPPLAPHIMEMQAARASSQGHALLPQQWSARQYPDGAKAARPRIPSYGPEYYGKGHHSPLHSTSIPLLYAPASASKPSQPIAVAEERIRIPVGSDHQRRAMTNLPSTVLSLVHDETVQIDLQKSRPSMSSATSSVHPLAEAALTTYYAPNIPSHASRSKNIPLSNNLDSVARYPESLAVISAPAPEQRASTPQGTMNPNSSSNHFAKSASLTDVLQSRPRCDSIFVDAEGARTLLCLSSGIASNSAKGENTSETPVRGVDWEAVGSTQSSQTAGGARFLDPGLDLLSQGIASGVAARHKSRWSLTVLRTVVQRARQAMQGIASLPINLSKVFYVPDPETLECFLDDYFDYFQVYLPFLHEATFDPASCHWLLVLAVAAIGARYRMQNKRVSALVTTCKAGFQAVAEDEDMMVRYDDPVTVELYQAHLLIRFSTGSMSHSIFEVPNICIVKWSQCTRLPSEVETPNSRWQAWIRQQMRKRLALSFLFFFAIHSILTETTVCHALEQILWTTLPDEIKLWSARSAEEWATMYESVREPMSLFEAMRAFVDPSQAEHAHRLVQTDSANARIIHLLHRVLHSKAIALQGVVAKIWASSGDWSGGTGPPVAFFTAVHDRLHKLLFGYGERSWSNPKCKPCFTVTPNLLAISANISLPTLLTFAVNDTATNPGARQAVVEWLRKDNGKVAKCDLWRSTQVWSTILNLHTHMDMAHWMRPYCVFYTACVIHAYGLFVTLANESPDGEEVTALMDAPIGADQIFLDELPDVEHPALKGWLNNSIRFRPCLGPNNGSGQEEVLGYSTDPCRIVRHAIFELEKIDVWSETSKSFIHALRRLLHTADSPNIKASMIQGSDL